MSSYQSLEHHEHAAHILHEAHEHGGEHGDAHAASAAEHMVADARATARFAQWTALMVACLAAGLAICEQGAKHAEINVQQRAIDSTDAWAQYQAKSTRALIARDVAGIIGVMDVGTDPARLAKRDALVAQMQKDTDTFENDPQDGKRAISDRARRFEEQRQHAFEATHAYHNGSASYELGIVLATASAITRNRPLFFVALALGVAGIIFSLLGWISPEVGAI